MSAHVASLNTPYGTLCNSKGNERFERLVVRYFKRLGPGKLQVLHVENTFVFVACDIYDTPRSVSKEGAPPTSSLATVKPFLRI